MRVFEATPSCSKAANSSPTAQSTSLTLKRKNSRKTLHYLVTIIPMLSTSSPPLPSKKWGVNAREGVIEQER